AAGKYETELPAGWSAGDWNCDGQFNSSDFITAFLLGWYENSARAIATFSPLAGERSIEHDSNGHVAWNMQQATIAMAIDKSVNVFAADSQINRPVSIEPAVAPAIRAVELSMVGDAIESLFADHPDPTADEATSSEEHLDRLFADFAKIDLNSL
ncbi:MAG: hypothetical protein KDA92_15195, partial [Planctomycetales bacterium]|nr:hypothetical protein [Planctomycetales bacterium]